MPVIPRMRFHRSALHTNSLFASLPAFVLFLFLRIDHFPLPVRASLVAGRPRTTRRRDARGSAIERRRWRRHATRRRTTRTVAAFTLRKIGRDVAFDAGNFGLARIYRTRSRYMNKQTLRAERAYSAVRV